MTEKTARKICKQTFAWVLALMMIFSVFPATQVNAATKPKLSKTKITMTVGQSKKLKVKGISKKRAKRIKWKSSKKKVVTVTKTGKLKARKAGKATITAKVGKKKLKCKVTVKKRKKKSNSSKKTVRLSKSSLTIQEDDIDDLTVYNATEKVKWSSSDKNIATVKQYKSYKNRALIYAHKKGTAIITAKANGKTFKCTVKVTADAYHPSDATETKIKQALSTINNSMSTQEKILKLTTWTDDHLTAFESGHYWDSDPINTVNCIVKGVAWRAGYNEFLNELLTRAGIKSKIIVTDYEHLKVVVDGAWYNLDPYLFEGPRGDTPYKGYDYSFFLFSDTQAYNYDFIYHYSKSSKQNTNENPSATSTRFDFIQYCIDEGKKNGINVVSHPLRWDNEKKEWVSLGEQLDGNAVLECIYKYNPWKTGTWRNY